MRERKGRRGRGRERNQRRLITGKKGEDRGRGATWKDGKRNR